MDNMGIITLLPPLFIIVFALVTRKTLEALILGGLIGCVIAYGKGFFSGYCDFFYATRKHLGNTGLWLVWIIYRNNA